MPTAGYYIPGSYPRLCDFCGLLFDIGELRRTLEGSFICPDHGDYRTAAELDAINLRVRPAQERAVPYPRPDDPYNPYTFLEEEGHLLAFISQMVTAGSRYLNVTSGSGAPLSGEQLPTLGWAAYYLYGLIVEGKRPESMLTKAESLLTTIATTLQTRQVGFGVSTSATRANNSAYGAFLTSGATTYATEETIMGGLALLYAYRLVGTVNFLLGARAAASYLRNVQAIGKYGVNHTATDSAGTGYLYTGSLCSSVSTVAGFYSNHLFYPSALLTLVFWQALQATDGDQQIGATTAIAGDFSQIPQQLMSASISDLRACWTGGITDSTGETINGLSATTPREFFNAYPATKANFTTVGTGRWEFYDGTASTGTQITGQTIAKALHALYVYEGASDQVEAIDDWLRGFSSNAEFETADNTSDSDLARATTGTYEPTKGITTLLLVRDADDSYADIAENGSSLYDWGAFGLLADLRAARHNGEFASGRRIEVYVNQRWRDGQESDGEFHDPIYVMGRSGLTKQTYFFGAGPISRGSPSSDLPPSLAETEGGVWFAADYGVSISAGKATAWQDKLPLRQDLTLNIPGQLPTYTANYTNGLPMIVFGDPSTPTPMVLYRSSNLKKSSGSVFTTGDARTVYAVMVPTGWNHGASSGYGGGVCQFRTLAAGTLFKCMAYNWNNDSLAHVYGNSSYERTAATMTSFNSTLVIMKWAYDGSTIKVYKNGVEVTPLDSAVANPADDSSSAGFYVGGSEVGTGPNGQYGLGEFRVFPGLLDTDDTDAWDSYLLRWTTTTDPSLYVLRDAVRAAQVGLSFREQPIANRLAGT